MNHFEEDPLEQLLDEQSDSEFGLPELGAHKQDLKTWTAQDFSNIYTRFHPHLLRHAKRYLTNHAQAEEVVQDAFLYLMTSLPEIDSEIGVLKLLKWKVRLLAIDVIRLNGKASFAPVEAIDDIAIENELSETLIKADEAAIVSLALAKLNPRQREALIASVYQEKETAQVASQLGLSENATRQLLFRAKSAFKKALVGEAETAGMSISQILSVAARKAAAESGKYISAASALLLVLAVSVGILPNLPQQGQVEVAGPVQAPAERQMSDRAGSAASPEVPGFPEDSIENSDSPGPGSSVVAEEELEQRPLPDVPSPDLGGPETSFDVPESQPEPSSPSLNVSLAAVKSPIGTSSAGFAYGFGADREQLIREVLIFSDLGLSVRVDLVRIEDSFEYRLANPRPLVEAEGQLLTLGVISYADAVAVSEDGRTLTLVATDLRLLDSTGIEYLEQPFAASSLSVTVELDRYGQVIGASVFLY